MAFNEQIVAIAIDMGLGITDTAAMEFARRVLEVIGVEVVEYEDGTNQNKPADT